jgi:hypothetical protein
VPRELNGVIGEDQPVPFDRVLIQVAATGG